MSLDKTSLREAPHNGLFQYYLRQSSSKAALKKVKKQVAAAGTDPQFEFWRQATKQIQKSQPTCKWTKEKPWRDNSRSTSRPKSASSANLQARRFLKKIKSQMSGTQYETYLGKVKVLNQKKDFLHKFRTQLSLAEKRKLVQQIKDETSHLCEMEAGLFD